MSEKGLYFIKVMHHHDGKAPLHRKNSISHPPYHLRCEDNCSTLAREQLGRLHMWPQVGAALHSHLWPARNWVSFQQFLNLAGLVMVFGHENAPENTACHVEPRPAIFLCLCVSVSVSLSQPSLQCVNIPEPTC